jgi:hypothetical protein
MATADQVATQIDKILRGFNFSVPGRTGKGMAHEVLDAIIEEVVDRSLSRQAQPGGIPWADNAESYKRTPAKSGKPIGVLTGDMMSLINLRGVRTIEDYRAVMRYGSGEFAKRKAQWFTRGSSNDPGTESLEPSGASNQPARPFYERDDQSDRKIRVVLVESWNDYLRRLGI